MAVKATSPSASSPGANLNGDLEAIRKEQQKDAVSLARFHMETAKTDAWLDAVKAHANSIRSGARA
jgi:hypothetical protein